MAEERGSFGIIGKAWEASKIYGGSNLVRHFDAIVESDSLKTLGNYAREHGIETFGMDFDSKTDDRLERYNMVKIVPTRHLDETNNATQMYLVTDEKGHDIGTYEITENGPVFKLSPRIQEHNEKIMSRFPEDKQEILRGHYQVDSLEELTEKLAKGEKLSLASEEQARDDIREEYEKRGQEFGGEEEQDPEEKDALDRIPEDMRGEATEFARDNGLKVKEILIIDNPENVADRIDNRQNQISENGGPVILIRANHGGADSLGDDVYALQDGRAVQNENNDRILENVMENHRDEGHVRDLDSDDNNVLSEEDARSFADENARLALEAQAIIEEAQKQIELEEEEIAQIEYNMQNFSPDVSEDSAQLQEQMEAQIQVHRDNIGAIAKDRDDKLNELMSRSVRTQEIQTESREIVGQDNSSADEINDDAVRSRWETADPMNNANS